MVIPRVWGLAFDFPPRRKLKSELIYGFIAFAFRTMTARAFPPGSASTASKLKDEKGKFMRLLFSINYENCRIDFAFEGWIRLIGMKKKREPLFLRRRFALSFASARQCAAE